ncbi:MAG TPA: hypothetical protein V6D02_14060 [Candidatus Obscuribacterales bacterium]
MTAPNPLKKIGRVSPFAPATPAHHWLRFRTFVGMVGLSVVCHWALAHIPVATPPPPARPPAVRSPQAPMPVAILPRPASAPLPVAAPDLTTTPERPDPSTVPPFTPPDDPPPPEEAAPPEPAIASPDAPTPPDDPSPVDPPPLTDPVAAQAYLVSQLPNLGVPDYIPERGLPGYDAFQQAGNAVCFIDPMGGIAAEATVVKWLAGEPQTLLNDHLVMLYGDRGLTFQPIEPDFCGEPYFQVMTAAGEPFAYISLATLNEATLLVIWATPRH